MIRTLALASAAALMATAASAAVTTIEYTLADGDKVTIAYDDATSTATTNGDAATARPYTWDEATSTVCSADAEGKEVCATFENAGQEAGHTTAFSTNDGRSGSATILTIE